MTQNEYDQQKAECWEEFLSLGGAEEEVYKKHTFDYAFKHGYALGKVKDLISQEDIEKAAEAFATPPVGNGGMFTPAQVKELLVKFAQLFPGKQEKDADETAISGWVARDEDGDLYTYIDKPKREDVPWDDATYWVGKTFIELDSTLFPDLTWESEPEPVEIIIKRKKNG